MTQPAPARRSLSDESTSLAPRALLPQQIRPSGRRAQAQAQRRTIILAAARSLLAENGFANISIRVIAERSGVTAPTIYNLVGPREQVLLEAMRQAIDAKARLAVSRAHEMQVNEILAYGELVGLSIADDPEYYRQITRAAAYSESGESLMRFFNGVLTGTFTSWLHRMAARGDLRNARVDPRVVSSTLVHHHTSLAVAWALW